MTRPAALAPLFALALAACPAVDPIDPGETDEPDTESPDTEIPVKETGLTDTDVPDTTAPYHIKVRPHPDYGTLVIVAWSQVVAGEIDIDFTVDGEWKQGPHGNYRANAGGRYRELLFGAPYEHNVDVRFSFDDGSGPVVVWEGTITTDDQPTQMPNATVLVNNPTDQDPDSTYILGSRNGTAPNWNSGSYWAFVMDRQGRILWARPTPQLPDNTNSYWTIFVKPSLDGESILVDHSTESGVGGTSAEGYVERMKLDGTVLEEWSTPGLHHSMTELPDGRILYGDADGWDEHLTSVTPGDKPVWVQHWSCQPWQQAFGGGNGYCRSNTVNYDAATGTVLFSFYTSSTVALIDASDLNATTWPSLAAFGQLSGSYDFIPASSLLDWQHGVHFLPNGHLLASTQIKDAGTELMVREFEVDHDAQTLTQVWTFGQGEGVNGSTAGEPHRLGNGNTLHNFGSGDRLREITPEGEVIWDVEWTNHLLGRTTFLSEAQLQAILD